MTTLSPDHSPTSTAPTEGLLQLTSEFSDVTLTIDEGTGLPAAVTLAPADSPSHAGFMEASERGDVSTDRAGAESVQLVCSFRLTTGGSEIHRPIGGLDYLDTTTITDLTRAGAPATTLTTDTRIWTVPATAGPWTVELVYTFRRSAPHLSLAVRFHAADGSPAGDRTIRNLVLSVQPKVDAAKWELNAPGNRLRSNLPLTAFTAATAVSPAGGLQGSAGLTAFTRVSDQPLTFAVWPLDDQQIGDTTIEPDPGAALAFGSIHLDLVRGDWASYRDTVPDQLATFGVTGPGERPEWIATARIYEVQIGFSVFDLGRWRYSPYPTATDLLDDLDRIRSLGFDTLQIMPRHPFPSYNVWDYDDVTTSWGDEEVIAELVRRAHERGMRVIFDILLHGVVDRTVVKKAADAVRNGPYAHRLDEPAKPIWSGDQDSYHVAYSRHIIDFEPHWRDGSTEHHPLLETHPEWFCRDSAGNLIGVYTHAFDNAHPGWQQYFVDSAAALVERLDIDGFRFDAPTYNYFANWSPRTRTHAGVSMIGCLTLFEFLRRRLRQIKPDVMMYTEPSGVLLRKNMDVNYNYDEQWLMTATLEPSTNTEDQTVRHARDVAAWFRDRDATLPRHSLTAHHIDSHDTFWWSKPGNKWLRERYDLPRTRAMLSLFSFAGGPFMMFTGGEEGIETDLRNIARLQREHPCLVLGRSVNDAVTHHVDHVHAILRADDDETVLVLINAGSEPVTSDFEVDLRQVTTASRPRHATAVDLSTSTQLSITIEGNQLIAQVHLEPWQTRLLKLS